MDVVRIHVRKPSDDPGRQSILSGPPDHLVLQPLPVSGLSVGVGVASRSNVRLQEVQDDVDPDVAVQNSMRIDGTPSALLDVRIQGFEQLLLMLKLAVVLVTPA